MAGNKNSGRRTMEEELARYKEKIKQHTLEELAASKVYNHLEKITENDRQGVKEIALPVALKGIQIKTDITSGGDKIIPILNNVIPSNNCDHKGDVAEQAD